MNKLFMELQNRLIFTIQSFLVFHEWIEVGKIFLKAKSLKDAWIIFFLETCR